MSSSGEIYGMHIMPDRFNTDILLPNGLCITIQCKREDTLENVKKNIWKSINSSISRLFKFEDQTLYIFCAITQNSELEEFYEESRRLCDLRLFDFVLKLIEPEGNKEEKKITSMIDLAIGKKLNELFLELPRELREEISDFRNSKEGFEESIIEQIDQGNLYSSYSSFVDVPFRIRIISATYVNVRNIDALSVKAAVYHGNECLGVQTTPSICPSNPKWDAWLQYDFHFTDLPRNAKICLTICIVSKKRGKESFPLCSGTMTLFNYRGFLRSGRAQLEMSQLHPESNDDLLYPLGALYGNPNSDSTCLTLEFWSFDRHVVFAPIIDVYTYAAHAIELESPIASENISIQHHLTSNNQAVNANSHVNYSSIKLDFRDRTLSNSSADTKAFIERRLSSSSSSILKPSNLLIERNQDSETTITTDINSIDEADIKLVNALISSPPFTPLTSKQKNLIWSMRFYCKNIPESLPKILDVIDWKSRNQISQLYVLLDEWNQVPLETALRLLDPKYEDAKVRRSAIKWLNSLLDEEMLSYYLIQFVQVLKTEPYMDNEMSRFLNQRGLSSPVIGNLYFWYLKSECDEINDYNNTIRFRYLMERYLIKLPLEKLTTVTRQVQALDKMMNLSEALNVRGNDRVKFMREQMQRVDFAEMLNDLPDPTNPERVLETLLYDQCRIMDSAKRPLWLIWENSCKKSDNPEGDQTQQKSTSALIFKVGDDLRQDMLTLQIIKIVDNIWRKEGLDMCMLVYTCLATGKNVGVIEVVDRAETITSIQKSGGRMAAIQIDSSQLHRWIKEKNEDNYDEAIQKFTRSCAGFSVLTFVLGIADRNPDNIMVNEDGRIFHIDFGHFLGHFKKKFGINRERVPFVLTEDFLQVIARGSDVRKNAEFQTFRELCVEAYFSLRKHSNLLITLFTLMLRTGIPELRSVDDISYLKTSLQVGVSEQKAREFFQEQFLEAYCGAWATKVDWFFHNIKRM